LYIGCSVFLLHILGQQVNVPAGGLGRLTARGGAGQLLEVAREKGGGKLDL
jgi:hypothetical protein